MSVLRRQPVKTLYILAELISILCIRVPVWVLLSIPRSSRPRKSWPLKRCVLLKVLQRHIALNFRYDTFETRDIVQAFTACLNSVGGVMPLPNHLAITGGNGIKGVCVQPDPTLIVGAIGSYAEKVGVIPIAIPAYWLDREGDKIKAGETAAKGEKVIYNLHGGAYVTLSAHPNDPSAAAVKGLLQHCTSVRRIMSVEYRLSSLHEGQPVNPFPAALLDAVAGYNYLVNQVGFAPEDIIVGGDSAGGNLALALMRYLVENKLPTLPLPSALLLLSPWADIGLSHITPGSSALPTISADYLDVTESGPGLSAFAHRAYIGPDYKSLYDSNPYLSPASLAIPKVDFKGFPKTLIISGDAELCLDSIRTLKKRMVEDLGPENVEYIEVADAVHDFLCLDFFEPERTDTLYKIRDWMSNL